MYLPKMVPLKWGGMGVWGIWRVWGSLWCEMKVPQHGNTYQRSYACPQYYGSRMGGEVGPCRVEGKAGLFKLVCLTGPGPKYVGIDI